MSDDADVDQIREHLIDKLQGMPYDEIVEMFKIDVHELIAEHAASLVRTMPITKAIEIFL